MDLIYFLKYILSRSVFVLQYFYFEVKYYFLGSESVVEDVLLKKKNVCVPIRKTGEIAVVTGGARGIGAKLVKKLLECDMHVIIGCRKIEAGLKHIENIRKEGVSTGSTSVYQLDLASFASIKKFAATINRKLPFLHLVVNNAGIMFVPFEETKDGFELHWAVNYLGPFLLTHLLLPLLEKGSSSTRPRIVNVTSCAHNAANPVCFDDLNMRRCYIPSAAYAQSKLGQILFTAELNRLLRKENSSIDVFAVHPGIVDTEIFNGTLPKKIFPWVLRYICKNADKGAITVLYTCISPRLEGHGGSYISNCRLSLPSKLAQNEALQKQLFSETLKTLGIENFKKAATN